MKKTAMIRARIEPKIKKQAEDIFKELGLNVSEAIGLFYHQVKIRHGMPFDVNMFNSGRKSGTASYALAALVKRSKGMTPQERLNAFLNHSYLLKKMENSGWKNRKKTPGK